MVEGKWLKFLVLSLKLLQTELAIEWGMIVMYWGIMFLAPASYSEGPSLNPDPVICGIDKIFVKRLSSGI